MDVSIIIPVYNVEAFIEKCISSVFEQNWGNVTFEVIVVDDASPDNSINIVKSIQEKFPQYIRLISQENKGLGGARNTGIRESLADYIFFLDSDDFLVNQNLPKLVKQAKDQQLDILEFAAERVDINYKQIDTIFHNSTKRLCSSDDYLEQIDFANSACNKLYRAEFLKNNKIVFFEKTYIEDAPFNAEALTNAKRILAVDIIPVAYLQNPNSITRAKKSVKRQTKLIEDSIKITKHILKFSEIPTTDVAKNRLKARVAIFVSGLILQIFRANITFTQKKNYMQQLHKAQLYPYCYKANIFSRDLFLRIVNSNLIQKIVLS